MPIKPCLVCSTNFYVKPYHQKLGYGKYCSSKCQHQDMKTGKVVSCFVCGREVYKSKQSLSRSISKKYFCTKSCQTKWRNTEFVGPKHANFINGDSSYKSILGRHKVPKICNLCSSGDSRVLAVHHIDGNHQNNDLQNLAWLCHNCHFLVHHDNVEKAKFLAVINKK